MYDSNIAVRNNTWESSSRPHLVDVHPLHSRNAYSLPGSRRSSMNSHVGQAASHATYQNPHGSRSITGPIIYTSIAENQPYGAHPQVYQQGPAYTQSQHHPNTTQGARPTNVLMNQNTMMSPVVSHGALVPTTPSSAAHQQRPPHPAQMGGYAAVNDPRNTGSSYVSSSKSNSMCTNYVQSTSEGSGPQRTYHHSQMAKQHNDGNANAATMPKRGSYSHPFGGNGYRPVTGPYIHTMYPNQPAQYSRTQVPSHFNTQASAYPGGQGPPFAGTQPVSNPKEGPTFTGTQPVSNPTEVPAFTGTQPLGRHQSSHFDQRASSYPGGQIPSSTGTHSTSTHSLVRATSHAPSHLAGHAESRSPVPVSPTNILSQLEYTSTTQLSMDTTNVDNGSSGTGGPSQRQ
jgi:hypothetical protein